MKNLRFKQYIYWGVTAVSVIAACIGITFLMINLGKVSMILKTIQSILMPVIYGMVLAYLLSPFYNLICRKCDEVLKAHMKNQKHAHSVSKFTASTLSLLLLIFVVTALFWMLIPELVRSIRTVITVLPTNLNNFATWIEQRMKENPNVEGHILSGYDQLVTRFTSWITSDLIPNVDKVVGGLSSGVLSVVVVIKNIFIGIMIMLYLLNIKTVLLSQARKIIYGILPVKAANYVLIELRYVQKVFSGFIIGKLLDSLIIGIIAFFSLSILNMPYVVLITVFIGVTNIIPFFGPFIGAIPSAFLILLVDPVKCLIFLLFVLLLQQLDGNVIGPRILGESTGLSSFWVLFSILFFGGLFGFVGMIVGVPAFAVIYKLVSDGIRALLKKKNLSEDTEDYKDLQYIDEETGKYVK